MMDNRPYLAGDEPDTYFPLPTPGPDVANADTAKVIYKLTDPAITSIRCDRVILQNLCAFPIKVLRSGDPAEENVNAAHYSFILPACSGDEKGDGGTYILYPRRDGVQKVSALAVGGAMRLGVDKYIHVNDKS